MLGTILLIVLIVLLIGALPTWPYSRRWGYSQRWLGLSARSMLRGLNERPKPLTPDC